MFDSHLFVSRSIMGEDSWKKALAVAGTVGLGSLLALGIRALVRRNREEKEEETPIPPDTVVVRDLCKGVYTPSFVPCSIKLQTFLRLAGIPYEVIFSAKRSSKGKWPWMQYNDKVIADSQMCIAFLKKTFNVDVNGFLTEEQKAAGHALQRMVDENTYWTWGLERWVFDEDKKILRLRFSEQLILASMEIVKNCTYGHGIGRHSREEILGILQEDLRALSSFMGKKKFLMGDRPCEADCAVFGQLSQMRWQCPESMRNLVTQTFPELDQYCERMKERLWPDWDDCMPSRHTAE